MPFGAASRMADTPQPPLPTAAPALHATPPAPALPASPKPASPTARGRSADAFPDPRT